MLPPGIALCRWINEEPRERSICPGGRGAGGGGSSSRGTGRGQAGGLASLQALPQP